MRKKPSSAHILAVKNGNALFISNAKSPRSKTRVNKSNVNLSERRFPAGKVSRGKSSAFTGENCDKRGFPF